MTTSPLPTFEELLSKRQAMRTTDDAKRLFWYLQDPQDAAIFVMRQPRDFEGPREAYCQRTLAGTTTRHAISEASLFEPAVSSITVKTPLTDEATIDWEDQHQHAEPGTEGLWGCVFGDRGELLECCGESRPAPDAPVIVAASTKPYVTVHDYISTLHPILMRFRDHLAMDGEQHHHQPVDISGSNLVVVFNTPHNVVITEEKSWLEWNRIKAC